MNLLLEKRKFMENKRLNQAGKSQLRAAVKPLINIEEYSDLGPIESFKDPRFLNNEAPP